MPDYRKEARKAAKRHGLDPNIFERQIGVESVNYDPDVIAGRRDSPAGARGIAQIMPDTAKGWGVDPLDAVAALDAAAKNMASYVKKYGGYENALRAYNAGPGAIERSRGYSETNNYVQKILNGRDPGKLNRPLRTGAERVSGTPSNMLARTQEVNPYQPQQPNFFSQIAQMAPVNVGNTNPMLLQLQQTTQKNWEMMGQLQDQLNARSQPRATTVSQVQPSRNTSSPQFRDDGKKAKGTLAEFFFDPLGGWDNGTNIGAIGGHDDHIHIGANFQVLMQLAKEAQAAGLSVREFAPFDKVDPVHTKNSLHYTDPKNKNGVFAADISGPNMAQWARLIKKRYGLR